MVKLLIEFEVADYTRWKTLFESNESARSKAGIRKVTIYHGVEKSTSIHLVLEAEDEKQAMDFFTSPDLRDLQVKSGVLGKPMVFRLNSL
jgi:hypothetical protein